MDNLTGWLATNVTYIDQNATDLDNVTAWLDANATKADNALSWLALNVTKIGNLKERVDNVSPRVDTLEGDLSENVTKIVNLKERVDNVSPRVDSLETNLDANETRITSLEGNDTAQDYYDITIPMNASGGDANAYIADEDWLVTKNQEVHVVPGSATPNVLTVTVMKCTGTQAPNAGTPMHNNAIALNGAACTVATPGLSSAGLTLAAGNRIALDYSGDATAFSGGSITIKMKRV